MFYNLRSDCSARAELAANQLYGTCFSNDEPCRNYVLNNAGFAVECSTTANELKHKRTHTYILECVAVVGVVVVVAASGVCLCLAFARSFSFLCARWNHSIGLCDERAPSKSVKTFCRFSRVEIVHNWRGFCAIIA